MKKRALQRPFSIKKQGVNPAHGYADVDGQSGLRDKSAFFCKRAFLSRAGMIFLPRDPPEFQSSQSPQINRRSS
jgi:hypothetical protein